MKIIKFILGLFFINMAFMSLFSGSLFSFIFFLAIAIYIFLPQNDKFRTNKTFNSYTNFTSYNFKPNPNYTNSIEELLYKYGNNPWNLMLILISINSYILAKLDGTVSKEEMNSLKESLIQHFGHSVNHYLIKESIDLIKEVLTYQPNHIMDYGIFNCNLFENYVLQNVRFNEKQNYLITFLLILYEILYKNNLDHYKQLEFLSKIERYFNLPDNIIAYIKNLAYFSVSNKKDNNYKQQYQNNIYNDDLKRAYKLFNLSPDAKESEIKKAFRKLAKEYHPDKYSNMPEQLKQQALEKFQEISAAYELLLKHVQHK